MSIFKQKFLQLPAIPGEKIKVLKAIFQAMTVKSIKPEYCANGTLDVNQYNPHANGLAQNLWKDCTRYMGPETQDDPVEFLQGCLFTHFEERYPSDAMNDALGTILYKERKTDIFRGRQRNEPEQAQYVLQLTTGLTEKDDSVNLDLNTLITNYQDWETLEQYTDENTKERYTIKNKRKESEKAKKKVVIGYVGEYLILQIKRTGYDTKTETPFKYENKINTPNILTIGGERLQLQGVILHDGGAGGGHYRYCKIGADGVYIISDSKVTKVGMDFLVSHEFMRQQVVLLYKNMSKETQAMEASAARVLDEFEGHLRISNIDTMVKEKNGEYGTVFSVYDKTRNKVLSKQILKMLKEGYVTKENLNTVFSNTRKGRLEKIKTLKTLNTSRRHIPNGSKIKVVAKLTTNISAELLEIIKRLGVTEEDLQTRPEDEKKQIINIARELLPTNIPTNVEPEIWAKVPQNMKNMWNSLDSETKSDILRNV